MEVRSDYLEHINITKDMFTDKNGELQNTTEEFEAIYAKLQEENVDLSNAKEFMSGLSKEELQAIKEYQHFADDIDVEALSDEGAYNALVHRYEKYDFDNDGYAMVGEARSGSILPQNMEADAKQALAQAYKTASPNERSSLLFMMAGLDQNKIFQSIAEGLQYKTPEQLAKFEESFGMSADQFRAKYLNYTPQTITYEDVKSHIESILKHNTDSASSAFRNAVENFARRFDSEYEKTQEISKNSASTEEMLTSISEYKQAS